MLIVLLATIALTVDLYCKTPKGYFPQDDTGLMFGGTRASPDISLQAMVELQRRRRDHRAADPAVSGVGSSVGGTALWRPVNHGTPLHQPQAAGQRDDVRALRRVDRALARQARRACRHPRLHVAGAGSAQVGGRQSQSQYQFTLWTPISTSCSPGCRRCWTHQTRAGHHRCHHRPRAGRPSGQRHASIARRRRGLASQIQDIDNALNDAFAQRQISTIFTQRNQYRVILEVDPQFQRDPIPTLPIYVPGVGGNRRCRSSAVARDRRSIAPLVVNHQGQFPSVTITYNLTPRRPARSGDHRGAEGGRGHASAGHVHADFAGDAKSFAENSSAARTC